MIVGFLGFLILIGIAHFIGEKWAEKPKKKKPRPSYEDEVKGEINRAKVAHFIVNYQPYEKKAVTEERDGKVYGYMR